MMAALQLKGCKKRRGRVNLSLLNHMILLECSFVSAARWLAWMCSRACSVRMASHLGSEKLTLNLYIFSCRLNSFTTYLAVFNEFTFVMNFIAIEFPQLISGGSAEISAIRLFAEISDFKFLRKWFTCVTPPLSQQRIKPGSATGTFILIYML